MTKPLSERLEAIRNAAEETYDAEVVVNEPRSVFIVMLPEDFDDAIREAAALARRVEGAPTSKALVAGWLAKAEILEQDRCIESELIAKVLRDCASELTYPSGAPCRLVPVEGGADVH